MSSDIVSQKKPRWLIIVGAVLIVLVVLGAWFVSQRGKQKFTTLEMKPENLVELIEVSGVVQPERGVMLKAPLGAKVVQRLLSENQRVVLGTPLLALDTVNLSLQLKQARTNADNTVSQAQQEAQTAAQALNQIEHSYSGNLLSLRNQLQQAEENLFFLEREVQRLQNLQAQGASSLQQLEQQQNQLKQAQPK